MGWSGKTAPESVMRSLSLSRPLAERWHFLYLLASSQCLLYVVRAQLYFDLRSASFVSKPYCLTYQFGFGEVESVSHCPFLHTKYFCKCLLINKVLDDPRNNGIFSLASGIPDGLKSDF